MSLLRPAHSDLPPRHSYGEARSGHPGARGDPDVAVSGPVLDGHVFFSQGAPSKMLGITAGATIDVIAPSNT